MHPGLQWFGLLNIICVIVCHCNGVSDRRILTEAGLGAGCPDEIARRCGAGADCGGCAPLVEEILEVRTLELDGFGAQLAS